MESIFIRKRLAAFTVLLGLGARGVPVLAQQTDPTLTAAVVIQTTELKDTHKKRKRLQERIIAAGAAVTVTLDHIHSVGDKMLEYLSNTQGAIQNLYQIERAGGLVTTEIPKNCSLLTKSVGGNLKGTVVAAIVSDELTSAAIRMAVPCPFVRQLATSGSYNITGSDGKNERHKVNLLNSSERYYIANEVVTRLGAINTDLFILAWQARMLSWNNLWFSLDPEGWANVMSDKNIIGGIVTEWGQGHLLKWQGNKEYEHRSSK